MIFQVWYHSLIWITFSSFPSLFCIIPLCSSASKQGGLVSFWLESQWINLNPNSPGLRYRYIHRHITLWSLPYRVWWASKYKDSTPKQNCRVLGEGGSPRTLQFFSPTARRAEELLHLVCVYVGGSYILSLLVGQHGSVWLDHLFRVCALSGLNKYYLWTWHQVFQLCSVMDSTSIQLLL